MDATVKIGQQGKLGNELLTVTEVSEKTFKCDNGKMYFTANAKWMTDGIETAATKVRKAKKVRIYRGVEVNEMTSEERRRSDEWMENARYRQAGSSLR